MLTVNKELTIWEKNFRKNLYKEFYYFNSEPYTIERVDKVWSNVCDIINRSRNIGYNRNVLFIAIYLQGIFHSVCVNNADLIIKILKEKDYTTLPVLGILEELEDDEIKLISAIIKYHDPSKDLNLNNLKYRNEIDYIKLVRCGNVEPIVFDDVLSKVIKNNELIEDAIDELMKQYGNDGEIWNKYPNYKHMYYKKYYMFKKELDNFISLNKFNV